MLSAAGRYILRMVRDASTIHWDPSTGKKNGHKIGRYAIQDWAIRLARTSDTGHKIGRYGMQDWARCLLFITY